MQRGCRGVFRTPSRIPVRPCGLPTCDDVLIFWVRVFGLFYIDVRVAIVIDQDIFGGGGGSFGTCMAMRYVR